MRTSAEVQRLLRSADLSALTPLRLHVLRNVTIEPMEPFLRYGAYLGGFRAEVSFSPFAGAYQESVFGTERMRDADCVILWMHLDSFAPRIAREFPMLSAARAAEELQRALADFAAMARGVRKQTDATLLCVGFHLPPHPALGLADEQSDQGQLGAVRALNEGVRGIVRELANAHFVDLNLWLARLGAERFFDDRYWHIGRAPFSREALRGVAESSMRLVLSLRGRARKCLVLDCDNVLWGGIAAEDGLDGIALGSDYPGSAFREFQQEVKNLSARGVILALCSKNDPESVWRVFREHSGMVLREEDITASRINWLDKARNLKELAEEIGIGLDSFVFMDDSEFEIERVRAALPMVEAVLLPRDRAVSHRTLLISGGWFDHPTSTAEDAQRGTMYRAEAARRRMRDQIPDLDGYLRSLEMVADVRPVEPDEIARVAQLTQRTNQFNLTTRRYSTDDIRALASDPTCDVIAIRLTDRFGDAGIVGAAITRYEGETARIDSFLMSCRVLGRGVEQVLAEVCVSRARERGCVEIEGVYAPSGRNGMVAGFWPSVGFRETRREDDVVRHRRSTAVTRDDAPWFKEIRLVRPTNVREDSHG